MPIFEFSCPRCKTKFEKLCSRAERDEPAACPDCGCVKGKRLMSMFAGHTAGGSIGGGGGCGGCAKSSCAGCHH
jgi:putative FmdB family regulatory protein